MNVKARIAMEKRIARETIKVLIAAGFKLSVDDGDDITVNQSTDKKALLAAMQTTDEDWLIAFDAQGRQVGSVYFVYGNDGYDVINDYSMNLEEALKPINELTEKLEAEAHR